MDAPTPDADAAIANDEFFVAAPATHAAHVAAAQRARRAVSVPEDVFYGDARRPPVELPLILRAAVRPLAFGGFLFLLGWLGILAQRSAIRQVVVGAPVFEEMAKFGLALVVVSALGARHLLARLPFAWLSGLGFGIFEHFLSYSDESVYSLAVRAAFHAGTCGLSMSVFSVLEPLEDVRARWGSTLVSSLLHWANNFAAIVLALVSVATPGADIVGDVWSTIVVVLAFGATIVVVTNRERLERAARAMLGRLLPPLTGTAEAAAVATDPRSTSPPAPASGPPVEAIPESEEVPGGPFRPPGPG